MSNPVEILRDGPSNSLGRGIYDIYHVLHRAEIAFDEFTFAMASLILGGPQAAEQLARKAINEEPLTELEEAVVSFTKFSAQMFTGLDKMKG